MDPLEWRLQDLFLYVVTMEHSKANKMPTTMRIKISFKSFMSR